MVNKWSFGCNIILSNSSNFFWCVKDRSMVKVSKTVSIFEFQNCRRPHGSWSWWQFQDYITSLSIAMVKSTNRRPETLISIATFKSQLQVIIICLNSELAEYPIDKTGQWKSQEPSFKICCLHRCCVCSR